MYERGNSLSDVILEEVVVVARFDAGTGTWFVPDIYISLFIYISMCQLIRTSLSLSVDYIFIFIYMLTYSYISLSLFYLYIYLYVNLFVLGGKGGDITVFVRH